MAHDPIRVDVLYRAEVDLAFVDLNPSDRRKGLIYVVFSKAAMRSAGVSQSRDFRGRPLSSSAIAAALMPSSTAAVVIGLPARTGATARLRNSTGNGRGMGEASQQKPDPQTIAGNQTRGHVKESTKPGAVPSFRRQKFQKYLLISKFMSEPVWPRDGADERRSRVRSQYRPPRFPRVSGGWKVVTNHVDASSRPAWRR